MSDPNVEYLQTESTGAANDIVPIKTKLWFGFGSMGESATNWIFNALTFLYYQQILGLSGTLAGAAVLVGIISDAITDPLMGSISDRFHSRFGRLLEVNAHAHLTPRQRRLVGEAVLRRDVRIGDLGLLETRAVGS